MRYDEQQAERERQAVRESLRKPTRVQSGPPEWVRRAMANKLQTKDMTGRSN